MAARYLRASRRTALNPGPGDRTLASAGDGIDGGATDLANLASS
jgi:hypothetical protein